jgi:diguanylate cyclase (GGDEF)-like protein
MPTPLKVLLHSRDRATLREVSMFLQKFGYQVEQYTEAARAAARLASERPDFLLLDRPESLEECRELCRSAGADRRRDYVYTLLICDDPRPESCTDAIAAGVDDFLARPLVNGELLARLRAGARVVEYERRVREQAGWDALTGLLSRASFIGRLTRELRGRPLTCVLLEIDDLDIVRHVHGHAAADELEQAVGGLLDQLGKPYEILARLEKGRFAAALQDVDEPTAVEWAEQLRSTVSDTEFTCSQAAVRATLSIGVAGDEVGLPDPEVLLKRASDALDLAQRSGHDCVVGYGECQEEHRRWKALAEPGKLFEGTLARHIMTPVTLTMHAEDETARLEGLFRQTKLPAIPVVDEKECIQGLVLRKAAPRGNENGQPQRMQDLMTTEFTRFDEGTKFATLLAHFRGNSGSLVVIVDRDTPTGLVTRRGLAALIEPLTADTFGARLPLSLSSDYLLVHDVCAAAGI